MAPRPVTQQPTTAHSRPATEQSASPLANHWRAPEEPSPAAMPLRWDDDCWLEEIEVLPLDESSLKGKHHPRRPDPAMRIRIYIWIEHDWQQYSGIYLGHGQSKTTFRLVDAASQTAALPANAVLKVARTEDVEPQVFDAVSGYGLCTPILYNGWGNMHMIGVLMRTGIAG